MPHSLPQYREDLAGFAGILRHHLSWSQRETAAYFHLNHTTVARYEGDQIKPPLGYLACMVRLVFQQRQDAETRQPVADQQFLLGEINKAIHDYLDEPPIRSWDELEMVADEYLKSRQNAQPPSTASAEVETNNVIAVEINSAFFIKALKDWNNSFFRWSEAKPHMRSSWAGLLLHALSALTDRITPRGLLIFCVSLLLSIVTASLVMPVLQWPLGNSVPGG